MHKKYPRDFYLQDTFDVAKKLLGSYLYSSIEGELTGGMITETEVYLGGIDKASHSFNYRRTKRTEIQFDVGGHAYIFIVYGMYPQLCVVTGPKDVSDVVLLRSLEPVVGIDIMKKRRNSEKLESLTNGPGKLCIALGIKKDHYGEDLCGNRIWVSPPEKELDSTEIISTKRIGIDYAEEYADKLWRFYIKDNKHISRSV